MVRGEQYGGRLVYEYDTKGAFVRHSSILLHVHVLHIPVIS